MSKSIERKARETLLKLGISTAPIPVELVARRLGIDVEAVELGSEISGVLVMAGERGKIGYNLQDSTVRQRFTIAHEIGHYVLHSQQSDLFIDSSFVVHHRDSESSRGDKLKEIQANQFAAALLMPEDIVRSVAEDHEFDLGDERALSELAQHFMVSSQAMSIRLSKLKLLPS